jgi:hypothetical protein
MQITKLPPVGFGQSMQQTLKDILAAMKSNPSPLPPSIPGVATPGVAPPIAGVAPAPNFGGFQLPDRLPGMIYLDPREWLGFDKLGM